MFLIFVLSFFVQMRLLWALCLHWAPYHNYRPYTFRRYVYKTNKVLFIQSGMEEKKLPKMVSGRAATSYPLTWGGRWVNC